MTKHPNPKVGDIVIIDPYDELGIRDRQSYKGICIKTSRGKSTVLVRDPDKKIEVPNKYLYPLMATDCPSVKVERAYNKVRVTKKDVDNLEIVKKTIGKLVQTATANKNVSIFEAKTIADCEKYAMGMLNHIQSKMLRLLASQEENDITVEYLNRFQEAARLESESCEGTVNVNEATEPIDEYIKNITETIANMVADYEISFDTVINSSMKRLKYYYQEETPYVKFVSDRLSESLIGFANENNNKTLLMLENEKAFDYLVGVKFRLDDISKAIMASISASTDEILVIPSISIMDPTKLIMKIKEELYDGDTNCLSRLSEDFSDSSCETVAKFFRDRGIIRTYDLVELKSIPIITFVGEYTVQNLLNDIVEVVKDITDRVYEETGVDMRYNADALNGCEDPSDIIPLNIPIMFSSFSTSVQQFGLV